MWSVALGRRSARGARLLGQPPLQCIASATSSSKQLNYPCHREFSSFASTVPVALRSKLWIPTEKEVPADAAIPSHQLLVRGGFIRKNGHGVYAFLPLAKRVISKLERIIDEEMAAIHGNKVDLPLIIPADLWQQSGRWQTRGPELITFADRREEMHALAPTHEESVTSVVAAHYTHTNTTNSSLRLYQIGKKFRDEIRPRFGLLRAREFIMKDMYSFDTTFDNALKTYEDVVRAYEMILKRRLRLPIAKVEADSGNIGGNLSHEFHVVADIGEDAILSCESTACGYAANVEKAHGTLPKSDVSSMANASISNSVLEKISHQAESGDADVWKTVVELLTEMGSDGGVSFKVLTEHPNEDDSEKNALSRVALVFTRGDREVNDLSLKSFFDEKELMLVHPTKFLNQNVTNLVKNNQLYVFLDESLRETSNATAKTIIDAATQQAQHYHQLAIQWGNFRFAKEGDGCPHCHNSTLEAKRGIEVGHVFYLGQKYSKPFDVTFVEHKHGQNVHKLMEMGCFGMGVTRLIAATVEVSHDKHGIIWPVEIAPYKVLVMCIGSKSADAPVAQVATNIASELASGSVHGLARDDVLLDDRWTESPGSKLAESELIGYPYRVVVGKRYVKEGLVEVQTRLTLEKVFLPPKELKNFFANQAAHGEL